MERHIRAWEGKLRAWHRKHADHPKISPVDAAAAFLEINLILTFADALALDLIKRNLDHKRQHLSAPIQSRADGSELTSITSITVDYAKLVRPRVFELKAKSKGEERDIKN